MARTRKREISRQPLSHVIIAADHSGHALKRYLIPMLVSAGYPVEDIGPVRRDPTDDYPVHAAKVARHVARDKSCLGVLICCTGVGMAIAANKVAGARAANCASAYCARMARQDNDANILALGGKKTSRTAAWRILRAFLETPFSGKERHVRRIRELDALDRARR